MDISRRRKRLSAPARFDSGGDIQALSAAGFPFSGRKFRTPLRAEPLGAHEEVRSNF